jgi:prepilin-type processing-associated H-X9-DG protein
VPLQWDWLGVIPASFNHVPGGCNVLFLDGHVEFIKYPGEFPVTETMARLATAVSEM